MPSTLIADFVETVTVSRLDPGSFVNGTWQNGAASIFDIEISLQPLTGTELQNLPEGQRTKRVMKGYTVTRLYTTKESEATRADQFEYDGTTFEIHNVKRWIGDLSRWDLSHYKVLAVEVDHQ